MSDVSPEQWLPVVGYEGLYEVSDHGQVRSIDRLVVYKYRGAIRRVAYPGQLLRPSQTPTGYLRVILHNGRGTCRRVHQLVCEAFHGPRPLGREVRHLNGISTDNRVENLTWGTRSENERDKIRHGTHHMAKKTHCKRGHPFDETNTRIRPGGRECRKCSRSMRSELRRNPAVREARNAHEREQRRIAREQREARHG